MSPAEGIQTSDAVKQVVEPAVSEKQSQHQQGSFDIEEIVPDAAVEA